MGDTFEPEVIEETPEDAIWVLDGRGRPVKLEVSDDADD